MSCQNDQLCPNLSLIQIAAYQQLASRPIKRPHVILHALETLLFHVSLLISSSINYLLKKLKNSFEDANQKIAEVAEAMN